MSDRKFNLHDGKKGSALAIRVTPRASRNEIVELLEDGTIKVRIAAPPSDAVSHHARPGAATPAGSGPPRGRHRTSRSVAAT